MLINIITLVLIWSFWKFLELLILECGLGIFFFFLFFNLSVTINIILVLGIEQWLDILINYKVFPLKLVST